MTNVFATPEKVMRRDRLFQIGIETLQKEGWKVEKIQGFGKSSVRRITKGRKSQKVSIRTSQDTWIAFPRNHQDNGWITLSDVDVVLAVSVDDRHDPKFAQVHMIEAAIRFMAFPQRYCASFWGSVSTPQIASRDALMSFASAVSLSWMSESAFISRSSKAGRSSASVGGRCPS